MPNKEFDLERYDHQHYHDDEGCGSEMTDHLFGDFVRHEEHLTTVQLVADELIGFFSGVNSDDIQTISGRINLIKDAKALIQSKFTDQIWEKTNE